MGKLGNTVCNAASRATATLVLMFAAQSCTEAAPTPAEAASAGAEVCTHGGKQYSAGETFASIDGCNSCMCMPGGGVGCSAVACTTRDCAIGDTLYAVGATFSRPGCESCTCQTEGVSTCLPAGCAPTCEHLGKVYLAGDTFRDGCDACTCTETGVRCSNAYCEPVATCDKGDHNFGSGTRLICEDGCNTCVCVDGRWSSTALDCPLLPKVERCDVGPTEAKVAVLYREGDALALRVGTQGACDSDKPIYKLCFSDEASGADGAKATLGVVDTNVGRPICSSWRAEHLVFDLSPLRELLGPSQSDQPGRVDVTIAGSSFDYTF